MAHKRHKRWFRYSGTINGWDAIKNHRFCPLTYNSFVLNVDGFQLVQLKNALGYNCVTRPILIDLETGNVQAYQVFREQKLVGYALEHRSGLSMFLERHEGRKPRADIKLANSTPFEFKRFACESITGNSATITRAGTSANGLTSTL